MARVIQFPMNQLPPIVVVDISVYNANRNNSDNIIHFDFYQLIEKSKNTSGVAVIMRSAIGAGVDYEFEYNAEKCIELGIPFGVYHGTKLWHNIKTQRDVFVETINRYKDYDKFLGAWLDIETNDGLSKQTFTDNAYKLGKWVQEETGVYRGIYTRGYFWEANTYNNDWMKKLDNWIAHWWYGLSPYVIPSVRPVLPSDLYNKQDPDEKNFPPVMWQFDPSYEDWGSRGDDQTDVNFFVYKSGTVSSFEQLFGVLPYIYSGPPEPPVIPGGPTEFICYKVKCLVYSLKVRSGPSTAYSTVGYLSSSQTVEALEEVTHSNGDTWVRIGLNQWSALRYGTNVYLEYL